MELATKQQLGYIVLQLDKMKSDYEWVKTLFDNTPKNNDKYPDVRCNYQRMILIDRLKTMTPAEADYCIKCYSGEKGYKHANARNIIIKRLTN
jgi:hypothetical protein